jgi:hypothetical protein
MSELLFYRAWLLVPIALPIVLVALGPITRNLPDPWLTSKSISSCRSRSAAFSM